MPRTDPASERHVLGVIFARGSEAYDEVADLLTPSSFTIDTNQILYRCVEYVCKQDPHAKIDYPTLMSAADALGLAECLRPMDEVKHVRAIMNMGPHLYAENLPRMAAKVRRLEIARELQACLTQAGLDLENITGDEEVSDILGRAENPLFDFTARLAGNTDRGLVDMGEGFEEWLTQVMDNPPAVYGIPTGFPRWDEAIGGGILPNSMNVIAGRAKEGKSQLACNMSLNIATAGFPVLHMDTEMDQKEHWARIGANLTGLGVRGIPRGDYGSEPDKRAALLEASRRVRGLPYTYACVIGQPFEDVLAKMKRWVVRKVGLGEDGYAKPCVIIYDYLKLTDGSRLGEAVKEWQELGFMATALKNFMGRYGVGSVVMAQCNREALNGRLDETVVAGSDRIVHYCTSLSFFVGLTDKEVTHKGDTHKLVPHCCRGGPGLGKNDPPITLRADYRVGRITEAPVRPVVFKVAGTEYDDVI
jgi:replicative DNA helicase